MDSIRTITNGESASNRPCFTVVEEAARDVLVLTGVLNLDEAGKLREAAVRLAARRRDVAIDWSAAGHVDASALQVLLALRAALAAAGRDLFVVRDNGDIRRYLELAGLAAHFPSDRSRSVPFMEGSTNVEDGPDCG
jgi:anti-anti-sigma regulatory factor